MKIRLYSLILILCFFSITPVCRAREKNHKYNFYFGVFHAHSNYSDNGDDGGYSFDEKTNKLVRSTKNTPYKAFLTAKKNGCDFYAITPHSHMVNSQQFKHLMDTARKVNSMFEGSFVAFHGQEWGDLSQGNHVNLMGGSELCDIPFGRFDLLYEKWLPAHPDVYFGSFNHPNLGRPHLDYGFDDYGSVNELVLRSDPFFRTINIIPGPKTSIKGYKRHVDASNLYYYLDFLNRGWHLSPTADEDNHRDDWGAMISARTVVLAKNLTEQDIVDAVKNNRVYATEDDEMIVEFFVLDSNRVKRWMGSRIIIDEPRKISFNIKVYQKAGTDGDPINEGDYWVTILGDLDGKGGEPAKQVFRTGVNPGELLSVPMIVQPGQYFLLHAREKDGKDNGGRDDDAYTSPIWFEKK